MEQAGQTFQPQCPRCGYDLSGHIATWESSCPVEGQCSECGLEFAWREVLVDRERANMCHVEHCSGRAIPLAASRTLLWSVLPWVFWKNVRLQHEPRVGRMLLWLGLILFSSHLVASTATAIALSQIELRHARLLNSTLPRQTAWIQSIIQQTKASNEFHSEEARNTHLKRLDTELQQSKTPYAEPILTLNQAMKAIGTPVLFIRDDSDRLTRDIVQSGPFGPRLGNGWQVSVIRFWRPRAFVVGVTLSLSYLMLILILPVTRRKLHIRRGHIARATILGMTWLLLPAILRFAESVGDIRQFLRTPATAWNVPGTPLSYSWHSDWALWSWILFAWISTWWLCAIWRGFRFPRPVLHWALLTIAAVLLTLIVLLMFSGVAEFDRFVEWDEWFTATSRSTARQLSTHNIDIVR